MITIELFSVFAKIALDVQEFEEDLDNAMKSMTELVDAVDAKVGAVNETIKVKLSLDSMCMVPCIPHI